MLFVAPSRTTHLPCWYLFTRTICCQSFCVRILNLLRMLYSFAAWISTSLSQDCLADTHSEVQDRPPVSPSDPGTSGQEHAPLSESSSIASGVWRLVCTTMDTNLHKMESINTTAPSNPEIRALQMSFRMLEAFMQVLRRNCFPCFCLCLYAGSVALAGDHGYILLNV